MMMGRNDHRKNSAWFVKLPFKLSNTPLKAWYAHEGSHDKLHSVKCLKASMWEEWERRNRREIIVLHITDSTN